MTQNASDVEIANQGFAAFRQDLNDILEDITTLHSGNTAPSTTYANQWWYETDTDKLYIRNEDNDAWIEILTLDQANDHLASLGATFTLDGSGNASIDGTFDVNGNELILDADGDTSITADTDDQIDFRAGGSDVAYITATGLGVGATPSVPLQANVSGTGDVFKLTRDTGTNGELNIDFNGANTNFNSEQGGFTFETSAASNAVTIASGGNVGIGTNSFWGGETNQHAEIRADVAGDYAALILSNTNDAASDSVSLNFGLARDDGLVFGNAGKITVGKEQDWTGTASTIDSFMSFSTDQNETTTERMRIDSSGNVMFNTTSTGTTGAHFTAQSLSRSVLSLGSSSTSGGITVAVFANPNGTVGSIQTNFSSTSFNTSSDYRLKENVAGITDGIQRVKQLNPSRFNFIGDADTTVDGFMAHEAQTVVPEAVTGTHNEVVTWTQDEIDAGDAPANTSAGDNKLDEDGNTIPEYQGIDQAKLVPLLTAALQEAIAKIETLETKVTALENA